jgi:hypothetical protein
VFRESVQVTLETTAKVCGKPYTGETHKTCVQSYVFRFLMHLYHVLHIGVYPAKLDVGVLQVIQTTPNYIPFGLKNSRSSHCITVNPLEIYQDDTLPISTLGDDSDLIVVVGESS